MRRTAPPSSAPRRLLASGSANVLSQDWGGPQPDANITVDAAFPHSPHTKIVTCPGVLEPRGNAITAVQRLRSALEATPLGGLNEPFKRAAHDRYCARQCRRPPG